VCGELPKVYKFEDSGMGIPDEYEFEGLKDGQILSIEGVTVKIIHTPGHTRDHASVHYLEENVMFSGDTILGEGTCIYEDLSSYMKSLEKIRSCRPAKIFPAHGPINHDGKARVDYYITHHKTREEKVLNCLLEAAPMPLSVSDIVKKIYSGVSASRQNDAREGIQHHVKKLLREGRIQERRGKYFIDEGF
jgi:glyoxylase-like metal-dependent hydrolase (beta-lactamase superfamily II)